MNGNITLFFFFFLSSFPGDIDLIGEPALGDTEVTRGRKKKQTNRWATFVPFFTAELGRWRSEDTLLRNCKKPWFCFKCSKLGTVSKSHCLSENRITKKKNRTAFWKHVSNYTAILQVKSKFTPFYIKDLCSNHNVLCATYGEKYNIICIFIYTQVVKKKEQKRKSNLIAHCYIDCF